MVEGGPVYIYIPPAKPFLAIVLPGLTKSVCLSIIPSQNKLIFQNYHENFHLFKTNLNNVQGNF